MKNSEIFVENFKVVFLSEKHRFCSGFLAIAEGYAVMKSSFISICKEQIFLNSFPSVLDHSKFFFYFRYWFILPDGTLSLSLGFEMWRLDVEKHPKASKEKSKRFNVN